MDRRPNFNRRFRRPNLRPARPSQKPLTQPGEVLAPFPDAIPGLEFGGKDPEDTNHPLIILRAGLSDDADECVSCQSSIATGSPCVCSYWPGEGGPAAEWERAGWRFCPVCAARGPDHIRKAWMLKGRQALIDSLVSIEMAMGKFDPTNPEDLEMIEEAEVDAGAASGFFMEAARIQMPGETWTP